MCEACTSPAAPVAARRRKLWEIDRTWHCSIVGTCLTLGDLNSIARKTNQRFKPGTRDYEIHVQFVRLARERNPSSRFMHKTLERRYRRTVARFAKVTCPEALETLWKEALEAGDVAGPYWALLTHPVLNDPLLERAFGDVHMLSHLVGASNRADMQALTRLSAESERLEAALRDEKANHRRAAADWRRRIADLEMRLEAERSRSADLAEAAARAERLEDGTEVRALGLLVTELQQHLGRQAEENAILARRLERKEERVVSLLAELRALERRPETITVNVDDVPAPDSPCGQGETCPCDLAGRCVLYVGGRPKQVCRLRAVVEGAGGRFLHHDGGVEKGVERLDGVLKRADLVFFPTDCVSHNAVTHIKRHCARDAKLYVPVRSAGVEAFATGLAGVAERIAAKNSGPDQPNDLTKATAPAPSAPPSGSRPG